MIPHFLRLTSVVVCATLFLPALTVLNSIIYLGHFPPNLTEVIALILLLGGGFGLLYILLKNLSVWGDYIVESSVSQRNYLCNLCRNKQVYLIVLTAGSSLLIELALIRYHSSMFPVLSFYKNFSLLASLAGLGAGYSLAKDKSLPLLVTPIALLLQVSVFAALTKGGSSDLFAVLRVEPVTSRLSMGLFATMNPFPLFGLYLFLFLNFMLTAIALLPVGQACGVVLEKGHKLKAYGWNLLGSAGGIVVMFVLGSFWAPPAIWFGVFFLCLLPFLEREKRSTVVGSITVVLSLLILSLPNSTSLVTIHSPYQQLDVRPDKDNQMEITAAGHYHQRIVNLSTSLARNNDTTRIANYYDLAYKMAPDLSSVAIVGAGSGNDVAAAIRAGSEKVFAIEIDPAILHLGRTLHPEKPYQNIAVTTVIEDARDFIRKSREQFDLLVFGLLDSHTLLSHVNSVRLESYVYTQESFQEARNSLKPGGVMSMAFAVLDDSLGQKLYQMITESFGGIPPLCLRTDYDKAIVFFVGKNSTPTISDELLNEHHVENITPLFEQKVVEVDNSTDDWPFFYMPQRVYPVSYLPLAFVVLVASLLVSRVSGLKSIGREEILFFFLGAGFMLIETKTIAELALYFGNTWHVVAVTISAILLMVYLANLLVQRLSIIPPGLSLLIVISLLLFLYFANRNDAIAISKWGKVIILTLPILFAGCAFSTILKQTRSFSSLLGANLLGAMVGGLLEYNAMYFGYNVLNILAAFFYGLAFLGCWRLGGKHLFSG